MLPYAKLHRKWTSVELRELEEEQQLQFWHHWFFRRNCDSLSWSSSTKVTSSLLQPYSVISGTQNSWMPVMPVKTEAKKALSTLAFSLSWVTNSLISFSRGPTFSLVFFFATDILVEAFLVAFDIPGHIQLLTQCLCFSPSVAVFASRLIA